MALTDKQKHQVIYYFGWPGLTLVSGSTHYNSVVNDRLGSDLNSYIENLVKGLLERLEKVDEQIEEARCRLTAESVDNIKLNKDELAMLRKERIKFIREMADHLDIPILRTGGGMVSVVS